MELKKRLENNKDRVCAFEMINTQTDYAIVSTQKISKSLRISLLVYCLFSFGKLQSTR